MSESQSAKRSAQEALSACADVGRWLAEYGVDWRMFEDVRLAALSAGQMVDTPWCHYPMGIVTGVLTEVGHVPEVEINQWCSIVAALAQWRLSQRVYTIDPSVLDELWSSQVSGQLPGDVLMRLPDWCLYVHLPGKESHQGAMSSVSGADPSTARVQGAWIWLETDDSGPEFRVLLHAESGDIIDAGVVSLAAPTLAEGARRSAERYVSFARAQGFQVSDAAANAEAWIQLMSPVISVALYLCVAPDLPRSPRPVAAGPRKPPRSGPTIVTTGAQLGAALRAPPLVIGHNEIADVGSHRAPRPHLRRAHWHTYLTGRGRELRAVRWIHPTLVVGAAESPTIRRTEGQRPAGPQAAVTGWAPSSAAEAPELAPQIDGSPSLGSSAC